MKVDDLGFDLVYKKMIDNENSLYLIMQALNDGGNISNDDLLWGFKDVAGRMIGIQSDLIEMCDDTTKKKASSVFTAMSINLESGFVGVETESFGEEIVDNVKKLYDRLLGVARPIFEGQTLGKNVLLPELLNIANGMFDARGEFTSKLPDSQIKDNKITLLAADKEALNSLFKNVNKR